MFPHILKSAYRHLTQNRAFSAINLLGLVIGLVSAFCIAGYLYHESTFDTMHPQGSRTYRVIADQQWAGENDKARTAVTFLPISAYIEENVPDVEKLARVYTLRTAVLNADGKSFIDHDFAWADGDLFDLLHYRFLHGNPETALTEPNTIVVTQSQAERLFGHAHVMGETIVVNNQELIVTGVIEDIPSNMHLKSSLIGSIITLKQLENPWRYQGFLYVRLHVTADPELAVNTMNEVIKANVWWLSTAPVHELQPIRDIRLFSTDIVGSPNPVNVKYLYIFGIIGIVLIISTVFNFISLTLVDFMARSKNAGIRKILGASDYYMIGQSVTECLLLCCVAAAIALILISSGLSFINNLLGSSMDLHFFMSWQNLGLMFIVLLIVAMLSALYPVMMALRFKPVQSVKNETTAKGSLFYVRKPLMTTQFAIAIVLTITVLTVNQQLSYLSSERLGFEKDRILVLKTPQFASVNSTLLKQKLNELPGVESVTVATGTPFLGGFSSEIEDEDGAYTMSQFSIDSDYLRTMKMTILSGRDLFPSDSSKAVVNEAMVHRMGWDNPIGETISYFGKEMEVVAVVQDFQLNNIHAPIHPAILASSTLYVNNFMIRVTVDGIHDTIQQIAAIWATNEPGNPLEYAFLDEQFDELFKSEVQFQRLSNIFTIIAIAIACLGLYGAILHDARHRTKEIGIRKILGASVTSIVNMLSREFVILVGVSLLIASPVAWFAMNRWLQDFAYRIEIQWWMFAAAGAAAVLLALITVSWQAMRVAMANPVDSLRDE